MYKISVIIMMNKLTKDKFKTLNSVINQTLKDIEIICVSDVLEKDLIEYSEKYDNINIQKDINKTLNMITGEYTVIANSNVFFESNWAQKVYDYAKIDSEDVIVCDLDIQDYQENKIESYTFENIENDKNKIITLNWNLCNLLFKAEKIKNIKLKANNTYNELLFILEALMECEKIGYAPDVKCYLYKNKSELDNIELKNIDELKDVLKSIKELYKTKNIYNEQEKEVLSAIAFSQLGVDTLIKVCNNSEFNVDMKELIKSTINYLDINFFEWRNNNILKSPFMKKEYSYIWYANKMYRYGYIDLYLKIYKFFKK